MKQIIILLAASLIGGVSYGQDQKRPVVVYDAPSIYNQANIGYRDYADQGSRMYENNNQFYNKDNFITNPVPVGNGDYVQPGNSTPVNYEMYESAPAPSGTIYSGYVPVRQYGNSSSESKRISR
jgi:hypothetical protein